MIFSGAPSFLTLGKKALLPSMLCTHLAYGIGQNQSFKIAPQVQVPITIIVKKKALEGEGRIYLDELADCKGYAPICAEAQGVDLGHRPPPGGKKTLSCDQVQDAIKEEFKGIKLTLKCPKNGILVKTSGILLDKAAVKKALQSHLDSLSVMEKVEVEYISMPLIKIFHSDVTFQFNEVTKENFVSKFSSYGSSKIEVLLNYKDKDYPQKFTIKAQSRLYVKRAVFHASLRRGHLLTKKDVKLSFIEKTKSKDTYGSLDDIVGKILKRPVREGQAVKERYIGRKTLVRRGSMVEVRLLTGGLKIQGRAKALETGGLSSMVSLKYLKTKKVLRGRVVGANLVEVRL